MTDSKAKSKSEVARNIARTYSEAALIPLCASQIELAIANAESQLAEEVLREIASLEERTAYAVYVGKRLRELFAKLNVKVEG